MLLTREAKPGYSSSKRQAAPSKGWFGGRHLGNPDQLLLAASCLTIGRDKLGTIYSPGNFTSLQEPAFRREPTQNPVAASRDRGERSRSSVFSARHSIATVGKVFVVYRVVNLPK
jgi:hypothetical protein